MENKEIVFILANGTYPEKTGGMEIFNFHLINQLSKRKNIKYLAYKKIRLSNAKYVKLLNIRPEKLFLPIQYLIYFATHPNIKKVILSYSKAHWIYWLLCYVIIKVLHLQATIVIHYGSNIPPKPTYVYKKFFESAKNLIVVSKPLEKFVIKNYNLRASIVPPLIPFAKTEKKAQEIRDHFQIPENVNIICMVGSLKDMKHPEHLLAAVEMFTKEELKVYSPYILFAGDGHLREELELHVQNSLKLNGRTKFLGNLPQSDVKEVLKIASIYVICSDFEGTSISLLESMYNKKAIVASNVTGISDMLTHTKEALLYEPGNIKQLYQFIKMFFSSEKLAQGCGQAAYDRFKKNYSYSDMLKLYEEII